MHPAPPAPAPHRTDLPAPVEAALAEVRNASYALAGLTLALSAALRILDVPATVIVAVLAGGALVACYGYRWTGRLSRELRPQTDGVSCVHAVVRFRLLTQVQVPGPAPVSVWCWGRAAWLAEPVAVHTVDGTAVVFSSVRGTLVAIRGRRPRRTVTRPAPRPLNQTPALP